MNAALKGFMLWASTDRDVFRSMGSGFRDKREHFDYTDLLTWFFVIVGLFIAIWFVSWLLARRENRQFYNSPRALFRGLCRAHELDRASRRLLRLMAAHQHLTQPARLFLEPERFEDAKLSPVLKSHAAEVAALRKKLFAAPVVETTTAPPAAIPAVDAEEALLQAVLEGVESARPR